MHSIFLDIRFGVTSLNESVDHKSRSNLENKMSVVFDGEIKELPTELQQILIDDLVTAFESRVNVLNQIQGGRRCR